MSTRPMLRKGLMLVLGALSTMGTAPALLASNHSDAPLIKQDPQANLTDVYAFIGTQYERFADDARYSIHITDPHTGVTKLRYDFVFSPVNAGYKNVNTIISYGLGTEVGPIMAVGDERQNFTQTYRVVRVVNGTGTRVGNGLRVPPPNVGNNVTPSYNDADGKAVSGATTLGDLDVYTRSTIYDLESGETVWAGPRDDSFFSDIPGIFDLLNVRILDNNGSLSDGLGQDGNGVDGFKGFNLLSIAVQIPVSELQQLGIPTQYDSVFFGQQTGVGVYALEKIFIPEVLRVATTTDAVRLADQAGFDRLGFIGGDTTNGVSGGWPNGRRFGDDVVDIALTAVASGPSYSTITVVGDNIAANDVPYHQVFPYLATPHSGTNNSKDSTP